MTAINTHHASENADRTALTDLVTDLERVQFDVESFLALHTADAIIVNLAGRRVLGAAALREAMTAAMASPLAQVRTTFEIDDIRFPAEDVAIVSATKHVHDERDGTASGALPTQGRLTYVAARTSDGWRIASAQTTPILGA